MCSVICKGLLKLFDKSFLKFGSIKINLCIVIIMLNIIIIVTALCHLADYLRTASNYLRGVKLFKASLICFYFQNSPSLEGSVTSTIPSGCSATARTKGCLTASTVSRGGWWVWICNTLYFLPSAAQHFCSIRKAVAGPEK